MKSINGLKEKRPIFHSEADFQHSLAVKIKEESKEENLEVRLERRVSSDKKDKNYVDIVLLNEDYEIFIELKYKTKLPKNKKNFKVKEEKFLISNQGAQDLGRYHFFSDIKDLENIKLKGKQKKAFAIFLTNDSLYWEGSRKGNIAENFEIKHERQINPGHFDWKKYKKWTDSYKSINLKGIYKFKWEDYSLIENTEFKFLMVEIKC